MQSLRRDKNFIQFCMNKKMSGYIDDLFIMFIFCKEVDGSLVDIEVHEENIIFFEDCPTGVEYAGVAETAVVPRSVSLNDLFNRFKLCLEDYLKEAV